MRRHADPKGDSPVGRDAVRNGKRQRDLCPVHGAAANQRVALIYKIEDRAYDQRHNKGAPRDAVADAVPADGGEP